MNTQRNEKTGQYAHEMEVMCECGHTKGGHFAVAPYPCSAGQNFDFDKPSCKCEKFRKAKVKK